MSQPDVVIAGAGPAGSTAAAVLAEQGLRVDVFEKETFPRFHVGESMIPSVNAAIERLGIDLSDEVFYYKGGARFICEEGDLEANFPFAEALPGPPRYSWHVDRVKFDCAVRDAAVGRGANVHHGVSVDGFEANDEGIKVQTSRGEVTGRYFLDATGLNRLVAQKRRAVSPYRHFGKAAVFAHFDGVLQEVVEELGDDHDLRIFMIPDGWIWMIPLMGRRISVGVVLRTQGISIENYDEFIAASPRLSRWTAGATRSQPRITSNFSYKNTAAHGHRYACLGDAACFLDPIFSSGIALAMNGACDVADRLAVALEDGTEGDPDVMAPVYTHLDEGYDAFERMIHRFYHTRMIHNLFLNAPKEGELRASIIGMLGGDVWRTDNTFRQMLLRSRVQPS